MKKIITLLLVIILLPIPTHADDPIPTDPGPPQDSAALAACLVAATAIAVGTIYIFARKCQPKYYWLMDDSEQPPKFWVATATKKECQVNGWRRIGGPYQSPQEAPIVHPPVTNTVSLISEPAVKISTQSSQDGQHWATVDQQVVEMEDFSYSPTNTGMFRLMITQ